MFRRIRIHENERGFAWKHGRFVRMLRPGQHWLFGFGWHIQTKPVSQPWLSFEDRSVLELLAADAETWRDLAFVRPGEHERALVWIDGRLFAVLRQGLHAFWRVARDVRIQLVSSSSRRVTTRPGAASATRASRSSETASSS